MAALDAVDDGIVVRHRPLSSLTVVKPIVHSAAVDRTYRGPDFLPSHREY